MLSNFNLSEGLTTATACAFYIRQLLHWQWIALMESVLLPFLWKDGVREEDEKRKEQRVRC